MEQISENYQDNVLRFDKTLGVGRSMDVVNRDYIIGGKRARIWVIDGYGKDDVLERMGAFWLTLTAAQTASLTEMQSFADRFISFSQINIFLNKAIR